MSNSPNVSEKLQDAEHDFNKAIEALAGFSEYRKTLDLSKDVSTDKAYQKNYVAYYKVRRDEEWLKEYFRFMQEKFKEKEEGEVTFKEILEHISKVPHKGQDGKAIYSVEASFASKMLATIYPEKYPIWDSQVSKMLGLSVPSYKGTDDKIQKYTEIYEKLTGAIQKYIQSDGGKEHIKEFDRHFPEYKDLSPYKKIDFYLWTLGKPEKEVRY